MAKKQYMCMSFLFFATLPLFGQVVDGYVFDEIDSTAIANVLVKVDNNSELFALTDSHGYFKLDSVAGATSTSAGFRRAIRNAVKDIEKQN